MDKNSNTDTSILGGFERFFSLIRTNSSRKDIKRDVTQMSSLNKSSIVINSELDSSSSIKSILKKTQLLKTHHHTSDKFNELSKKFNPPVNSITSNNLSSNIVRDSSSVSSDDRKLSKKNNTNQSNDQLSENGDYRPTSNDPMHKFYVARLKHSLIISFLILMSIQNFFHIFISLFSRQVSSLF